MAKELIRKIKSLKNILDKDASTDCTVKDIRSANTCTPHSAGCLHLPFNDLLHKLLEFSKSTSHISVLLFGIDLKMKGCNLLSKQYLYSSYSLFLVSKNILSFRAVSVYLSFLLLPATGNIAECCWYDFCPVPNLKKIPFVQQFLQELNKLTDGILSFKRTESPIACVCAQRSVARWKCLVPSSTQNFAR